MTSPRDCFVGKITAGQVATRAGRQILDMLDGFEKEYQGRLGDGAAQRQATLDAIQVAEGEAARRVNEIHGSIIAQANVLRARNLYRDVIGTLRESKGFLGWGNQAPPFLGSNWQSTLWPALRSLMMRDPNEIGSVLNNVEALSTYLRGKAHALMAQTINDLAPKMGNLLRPDTERELNILRTLHGETVDDGWAKAAVAAWNDTNGRAADEFIAAGGKLTKRENWRLPNPDLDAAKIQAMGADRFKAFVREHVDRSDMPDYATGKPMTDARFEQIVTDVYNDIVGTREGLPTARFQGRRALANQRDFSRFFSWKSAESWRAVADTIGTHQSVLQTMTDHINRITHDTAMMRVWGPNPEATRRYAANLFDREAGTLFETAKPGASQKEIDKIAATNRKMADRIRADRQRFEDGWNEMTGLNRIPVSVSLAQTMADVRQGLTATHLGSAMLSSLTDPGTFAMTTRFNGLPVAEFLSAGARALPEKGFEVYAAQQGLVFDSIAHGVHGVDRQLNESLRTNAAAKVGAAVIRAQGLRAWSARWRGAWAVETMGFVARNQETAWRQLPDAFRAGLERYGLGEADWKIIQATAPATMRANAPLVRPMDVEAHLGNGASRAVAEKYSRFLTTEMNYALIENDSTTRAMMLGSSRAGTVGGEFRRAITQFRAFPAGFMTMHIARAFARGWDGSRLAHGAMTFIAMTLLGTMAMQLKHIAQGRDPLTLDPTTANGLRAWGAGIIQGGGLGVFGDMLFIDQTRYGNTWAATAAGPLPGAVEAVLGDFLLRNIQKAAKGEQTHFLGDAIYTTGRYMPGSNLWFSRLAFQREVLDRLMLWADPQGTRERHRRMEKTAQKELGQSYWWAPGRTEPARAPAIFGGRP